MSVYVGDTLNPGNRPINQKESVFGASPAQNVEVGQSSLLPIPGFPRVVLFLFFLTSAVFILSLIWRETTECQCRTVSQPVGHDSFVEVNNPFAAVV